MEGPVPSCQRPQSGSESSVEGRVGRKTLCAFCPSREKRLGGSEMKTNKMVAILVAVMAPLLLLTAAGKVVAAAGAKGVEAELAVPKDWVDKAKVEGKIILDFTGGPRDQE